MNLNTASTLKAGDTVYNCFGQLLVITGYSWKYKSNGQVDSVIFETKDANQYTAKYSYDDIYEKDLLWESDEERSWIEWASNNKTHNIFSHIDIPTAKSIYKIGFADGFQYQRRITYEELMQK